MGMSDRIEAFIDELLKDATDDWLELKRNELASVFGCVPSQINYVISTRFNAEHGYVVESKRGGGGYLRIKQIYRGNDVIMQAINSIGDSIDEKTSRTLLMQLARSETLTKQTISLIFSGISDNSLSMLGGDKNIVRASILKNMLANASEQNSNKE